MEEAWDKSLGYLEDHLAYLEDDNELPFGDRKRLKKELESVAKWVHLNYNWQTLGRQGLGDPTGVC